MACDKAHTLGLPATATFSLVPQNTAHPHPPKRHPRITTVKSSTTIKVGAGGPPPLHRPIDDPRGPDRADRYAPRSRQHSKSRVRPSSHALFSLSVSLCVGVGVKSERRRRRRAMAVAASLAKKVMRLTISLFGGRFDSSKCKTAAKMTVARIKLLRNKRQAVVKQMRRDIALLLQSGQDATARVRVEHVLREQNILAANEFIELFCELIVARLQIIAKQRECPADLKEGISSLIFAAPRCSEIPELAAVRKLFEKKYGKDFVSAAIELRPNCGVNRMLIDKLSVRTPSGETKLKVLKEIAKEYRIEWDTTESEQELLKPPEEKIEGPQKFVSAASFPVKPVGVQSVDPNEHRARPNGGNRETMPYEDSASAAEAAAESARKAVAAAQAAAYLANKEPNQAKAPEAAFGHPNYENYANNEERRYSPHMETGGANRTHSYNSVSFTHLESKFNDGVSVEKFRSSGDDDLLSTHIGDGKMYRRHSYNAPSKRSNIKFDESDYEEDEAEDPCSEACPPPARPPALAPSSVTRDSVLRVHPKLPDYDDLAARFEALKYRK